MVVANIKMIRIINLWSIVESQTWPEFYRYDWRLNLNSSWTEGHTSQLSSNWTELIWSWITCIRVDRFFRREPARGEKSGRLRYVRTKSWIQNRPKILLQSHRIFVNPSNPCTGSYFLTSYLTFFVNSYTYTWSVPHLALHTAVYHEECRTLPQRAATAKKLGAVKNLCFLEIEQISPKLPRLAEVILFCKIASSYDRST